MGIGCSENEMKHGTGGEGWKEEEKGRRDGRVDQTTDC
jgi:hypothetical protein